MSAVHMRRWSFRTLNLLQKYWRLQRPYRTTLLITTIYQETTLMCGSDYDQSQQKHVELGFPRQIGCVSVTEDRDIHPNSGISLATFQGPKLFTNLREGFSEYIRRTRVNPYHNHPNRLDRILAMILDKQEILDQLRSTTAVMHRGVLKRILSRRPSMLNVSMLNGVLYVETYDPSPERMTWKVHDGEYYGTHFETVCCGKSFKNLDLHARWYNGMVASLGGFQILYAGEVDAELPGDGSNPAELVEIKLKGINARNPIKWNDWYLQSFLTGVSKIFLGYAMDYSLYSTETVEVLSIPAERMSETQRQWRAIGFQEAHTFLEKLHEHCMRYSAEPGSSEIIWRVTSNPKGRSVTIRRLDEEEIAELNSKDAREGILPMPYVQSVSARI